MLKNMVNVSEEELQRLKGSSEEELQRMKGSQSALEMNNKQLLQNIEQMYL